MYKKRRPDLLTTLIIAVLFGIAATELAQMLQFGQSEPPAVAQFAETTNPTAR